ncbi:hypothetical protein J6590_094206 [Homalodisca vitripennis]|nr:hypothetical protein J6590_094206 [Homalodisca vitripennis]
MEVEGSTPAVPDGGTGLPEPLATLLGSCAASQAGPSAVAQKGFLKGHSSADRPNNTIPPGTGDQGEVGTTPESCHATGTSTPVAQLMVPAISGAHSKPSGRPAVSFRKRQAALAPTLPPQSRKRDIVDGQEMEVERGPRIPPIILDVSKGWASHAVTIKQLVEGDLEAVCTARTLRLKISTVAHFRALQR